MAYFCDLRRHVNFSHFACILYGTWLFLKTGFYTPVFHEQNLHCLSLFCAELRICCSWDNNLSHVCILFFDQMPGSCSYFTCKVRFQNSISRLRVIAKGDVLVYRYTHLTSILETYGSSPGVSNNICLHFIFWPFTVPSPLSIKTRRIANNVINNPIFFIITLFSLNPLSYITILNRIPEGGAVPLSIMVIWKALFSIESLSLLSLALLLLLSCSAPLLFWSVSASFYLSSLSPSPSLSLSLALRPSYSLGLSPSALQLKLD